jgi:1-aminocyclopropane-1-carboxylate deaminase
LQSCIVIFDLPSNVPLQPIYGNRLDDAKIKLSILRLDLIDPVAGGNKWFKLIYNLDEVLKKRIKRIVTFGGAYSNHIAAICEVKKQFPEIEIIALIRGEESSPLNITLSRAQAAGAQIIYVSRQDYRDFRNPDNYYKIYKKYGDCTIIPEGGANVEGVLGSSLMGNYIPPNIDHVFIPVGTGTTLAGLALSPKGNFDITGIAVLNGKDFLTTQTLSYIQDAQTTDKNFDTLIRVEPLKFEINCDYNFGGYAKSNEELSLFVQAFSSDNLIPIEPIYTGKMFFGLMDLIVNNKFKAGSNIVAIHTGGMQYLGY